ncbi:MAG: hypothetical protein WBD40_19520 [Tepidisphaeraceae bacterium]
MTFREWQEGVPEPIRGDTLWLVEAYRLGLFISDLVWDDCDILLRNKRTIAIADQIYRAAGKISSNIACSTAKPSTPAKRRPVRPIRDS